MRTISTQPGPDAGRALRRLWRSELPVDPVRRGPKPRLDLDTVIEVAVRRADTEGLSGLSVRTLAEDLGLSRMAVYGYVGDRDELIDLMVEQVNGALRDELAVLLSAAAAWTEALRRLAEAELRHCRRHRWLLDVGQERPVLGPASTEVYERELAVLDGIGLSDLEMDQVRWQLLNFVRGIARDEPAAVAREASTGVDTQEWWRRRAALLAELITEQRFPLAVRVGTAAGQAQGGAYDPAGSFEFGLERLLAGVAVLVAERAQL